MRHPIMLEDPPGTEFFVLFVRFLTPDGPLFSPEGSAGSFWYSLVLTASRL